jgi:hypothetical protein
VGKKKEGVNHDNMASGYVEMGHINLSISEDFNSVELKDYLKMEECMNE